MHPLREEGFCSPDPLDGYMTITAWTQKPLSLGQGLTHWPGFTDCHSGASPCYLPETHTFGLSLNQPYSKSVGEVQLKAVQGL